VILCALCGESPSLLRRTPKLTPDRGATIKITIFGALNERKRNKFK
jgi:hypothetical protein